MTIKLTPRLLKDFRLDLTEAERSRNTISKYIRDAEKLMEYSEKQPITKEILINYKTQIVKNYAPASVNSMISAINRFLDFMDKPALKLKPVKIQRNAFSEKARELSKSDYLRLIEAANRNGNRRLSLIIQTICSTGIRVSELPFITAQAVSKGKAEVRCKGKIRTVFLPDSLCEILGEYLNEHGITSGPVFITRYGNPVNRSHIYEDMQKLGKAAGIPPEKLFPHNLRRLFARTYYSSQKDIARLADILGHSNTSTTRIYIKESGETHAQQINSLDLVPGIKKVT